MIDSAVSNLESLLYEYKVKSKIEMKIEYSKGNDYSYLCNFYKQYSNEISSFLKDNDFYKLERITNSELERMKNGQLLIYIVVLEEYRKYYLQELENLKNRILELRKNKYRRGNTITLKELMYKQKMGLIK